MLRLVTGRRWAYRLPQIPLPSGGRGTQTSGPDNHSHQNCHFPLLTSTSPAEQFKSIITQGVGFGFRGAAAIARSAGRGFAGPIGLPGRPCERAKPELLPSGPRHLERVLPGEALHGRWRREPRSKEQCRSARPEIARSRRERAPATTMGSGALRYRASLNDLPYPARDSAIVAHLRRMGVAAQVEDRGMEVAAPMGRPEPSQ